jgi:hypothetical protein
MARNCLDGEWPARQLCGGKAAARSVKLRSKNCPLTDMECASQGREKLNFAEGEEQTWSTATGYRLSDNFAD